MEIEYIHKNFYYNFSVVSVGKETIRRYNEYRMIANDIRDTYNKYNDMLNYINVVIGYNLKNTKIDKQEILDLLLYYKLEYDMAVKEYINYCNFIFDILEEDYYSMWKKIDNKQRRFLIEDRISYIKTFCKKKNKNRLLINSYYKLETIKNKIKNGVI